MQSPESATDYFARVLDGTYPLTGAPLDQCADLTNAQINDRLVAGMYVNTKTEMEAILCFTGVSANIADRLSSFITNGNTPDWHHLPSSLKIAAVTVKIGHRGVTRYAYRENDKWFINNRPRSAAPRQVAWFYTIKEVSSLRHLQSVDVHTTVSYIKHGTRRSYHYNFTEQCVSHVSKTLSVMIDGLLQLDEEVAEEINVSPKRLSPPPRPPRALKQVTRQ